MKVGEIEDPLYKDFYIGIPKGLEVLELHSVGHTM